MTGAIAIRLCVVLYLVRGLIISEHTSVRGTVLETRIDLVGSRESQYGGYIAYQAEARVKYRVGGFDQVR
jgi:hypothetical protein